MSEWITDRLPTEEDARVGSVHLDGYVFVMDDLLTGEVEVETWKAAAFHRRPWMPIVMPAPYVEPKRYGVRYSDDLRCWSITKRTDVAFDDSCLFEPLNCLKDKNSDLHRKAAEEIAVIYERTMP